MRSKGQIGYEAYAEQQSWTNYRGDPIPPWHEVRPDIQEAWEIAARAIIKTYAVEE